MVKWKFHFCANVIHYIWLAMKWYELIWIRDNVIWSGINLVWTSINLNISYEIIVLWFSNITFWCCCLTSGDYYDLNNAINNNAINKNGSNKSLGEGNIMNQILCKCVQMKNTTSVKHLWGNNQQMGALHYIITNITRIYSHIFWVVQFMIQMR